MSPVPVLHARPPGAAVKTLRRTRRTRTPMRWAHRRAWRNRTRRRWRRWRTAWPPARRRTPGTSLRRSRRRFAAALRTSGRSHDRCTRKEASATSATNAPEGVPHLVRDSLGEDVVRAVDGRAAPAPPEQAASRRYRLYCLAALRAGAGLALSSRFGHHDNPDLSASLTSLLSILVVQHVPPVPFSRPPAGRGTAQVGTPSLGRTTHCSSSHAPSRIAAPRSSPIVTTPPPASPPDPSRSRPCPS